MLPRIKICGLTRVADLEDAVHAGADALGLVFYRPSPRFVDLPTAARLARAVPPFVTLVGLFVNADPMVVRSTLAAVPMHLLQWHGDEDEAYCRQFDRPYIKAARVRPGMDLLQYAAGFPSAQAILLDAFVDGYGGGGKVFDWSLVPRSLGKPLVLSGGLDADNVGEAVRRLQPDAVDVSSGVEASKGIKDVGKMNAFVAAVRAAGSAGER
ncbi:MAG: phosphoribosylanthranilate isomerase [Candidatus Accumulibacter sp.]|uniref:phosphoribosylanthranilate isomerase n=1 Tax=Accumulibacter sp. TaxID=2053492 RepID=UPI001A0A82D1|nr:phosphoribosylanthranilate isomerase [Accumulibacter sp.]MBE2257752.1 phosphoribosylanthranilate isomerase [Paracoccaceae bacterium]MCB1943115.1 phosphoribosylanthranilate isomerase [Accumulibacter sp.]MCP5248743.1 phosphoribosylanthranilate isomerase [Accumulibacter sp.]